MDLSPDDIKRIAGERRRISLLLSAAMLVVYFGFILLGAYAKEFMGAEIVGGLSFGIVLGAIVIVVAFALTGVYVRWANRHDAEIDAGTGAQGEGPTA